jgi:hypothetical protein
VLVCCAIACESTGLLCLLPALLLACVLLLSHYPGERMLIARSSRMGRRRWPRARSASSARARALTTAAHGGLLIARSLAVRPPPALSRATA